MQNTYPKIIEYSLDHTHQKQWCLILCKFSQNETSLPCILSLYHDDSHEWEETQLLRPFCYLFSNFKCGILYVSAHSQKIGLSAIQQDKTLSEPALIKIIPLSRFIAAWLLTLFNPLSILKTLLGSPQHLKKRLRSTLSHNYTQLNAPLSYEIWCKLYDSWNKQHQTALYNSPFSAHWPAIDLKIYNLTDSCYPETKAALDQQWKIPKKSNCTYIAILQNGEILPPQSLAIFADQAAKHDFPAALYADSDLLNHNNQRDAPLFKPNISYLTLTSGLLTQDIWLFRKDIIDKYQQNNKITFQSAYTHRLSLALYVWKQQQTIHHIPFILNHRKIAPTAQIIKEMQEIVTSDLIQKKYDFVIEPNIFPLKIKLSSTHKPVSLVIPTTISSKTIHNCIQSILKKTNYPNFEVILVISQTTPLTHKQRTYLRPLLKYKNLTVHWLKANQFNFSASCNFGIHHAKHEFIAVINDDISPKTPDWLNYMMGNMQQKNVGVVGAKLFYPNGQIQHAGILMGAANLCDHIGRFEHSKRFTLTYDHNVSAVTGACMLIRRTAYTLAQGFDEYYEIAYNDVDFCLKLRQAGFQIIQCQQAQLIHYESLSLGNHYTGIRAGKERQEILSIRSKYKAICNQDPFYNPNLSLQRGMDGKLAFPVRITRPFATPFLINK